MMKSPFILYIVCMKFLDPESRLYCATGKYTSLRGSLHSLWIGTGRGNRDISAHSHGLHRVKLVPRRYEEASETLLARAFRGKTNRPREKERDPFLLRRDPSAVTHYPRGIFYSSFPRENAEV